MNAAPKKHKDSRAFWDDLRRLSKQFLAKSVREPNHVDPEFIGTSRHYAIRKESRLDANGFWEKLDPMIASIQAQARVAAARRAKSSGAGGPKTSQILHATNPLGISPLEMAKRGYEDFEKCCFFLAGNRMSASTLRGFKADYFISIKPAGLVRDVCGVKKPALTKESVRGTHDRWERVHSGGAIESRATA